MSNITYRRGQVEWALWQLFRLGRGAPETIAPEFLARIKKLLDLDRGHTSKGIAPDARAFADVDRESAGRDAEFEVFDAFCLALGLDLLDAGFLQSETVFVLRETRLDLREEFDWIVEHYPPVTRARRLAKDYPHLPHYLDKGTRIADTRVYMLLRKIELIETLPSPKPPVPYTFTEPRFAYGRSELATATTSISPQNRSALVLEIGGTAKLIEGFLARAPIITRARKN